MTILDFCRNCGILLEPLVFLDHGKCGNCNVDVRPTAARIQGQFTDDDARQLHNPPIEQSRNEDEDI
jgi:hypothetical protein